MAKKSWLKIIGRMKKLISEVGSIYPAGSTPIAGYAEGGPSAFIARFESFSPLHIRAAATTATQAAPGPVARARQVGSLVTNVAPKLAQVNWNLIAGISAGLLVICLIFRRGGKSRLEF